MELKRLNESEIFRELSLLDGWNIDSNSLRKEFNFRNFIEAFSFMTKVALISESYAHHPDWQNIYNKVWIKLYTHELNGITVKDIQLAHKIDETHRETF